LVCNSRVGNAKRVGGWDPKKDKRRGGKSEGKFRENGGASSANGYLCQNERGLKEVLGPKV